MSCGLEIKVPSKEELAAWADEREADLRRRSEGDSFNPVNLGHWIALCRQAGVPFVPADEIARVPTRDLLRFDEDPALATLAPFFSAVSEAMAVRPRHMVRWAACSGSEIKYRLGNGEPQWRNDFAQLVIDDPRAYDLIGSFPELTIAAYARPWMDAAVYESYPVEYRVFVDHGVIVGICNYYPQRALPNNAETLNDIATCLHYARRLIVSQRKPMNWPPIEQHWDITKLSCSMDFMRLGIMGDIMFLEGGPPYSPQGGSHPCCFAGRDPDGIAFAATAEGLASMGLGEGVA